MTGNSENITGSDLDHMVELNKNKYSNLQNNSNKIMAPNENDSRSQYPLVRNAKDSDLERMVELYLKSNPHNTPEEIRVWTKKNYESPPPLSFVFEVDGKIYGAVTGKVRSNGHISGVLEDVVADWHSLIEDHPEFEDYPLGEVLLNKIVDTFASYGFENAELVVYKENQNAKKFYEKNGWKVIGEIKTDEIADPDLHSGHEVYVMEYDLTQTPVYKKGKETGFKPIEGGKEHVLTDVKVLYAALIP